MIRETDTLYECRNCGGVVASRQGHCPYCKHSKGPKKTVGDFDGGVKEVRKSWYRRVKIQSYE